METIPQDLAEAVRAAAGAAPGYPGDLTDVRRRVRRRRDRNAALAAAGVVAVLAVTGLGTMVVREPPGTVQPAAGAEPGPPDAEQPLLLLGANGGYRSTAQRQQSVVDLDDSRVGVVDADGGIVAHWVADVAAWSQAVGTPAGGVVALGSTEAAYNTAPRTVLMSFGPDGRAGVRREMSPGSGQVGLVASSTVAAYLWRPAGLVEHDLATGAEKTVMTSRELDFPDTFDGELDGADLTGDRLALARRRDACTVDVLAVPDGSTISHLAGNRSSCERVTGVRLSPDGTMAAVTTAEKGDLSAVTVWRVADATVLARAGGLAHDPRAVTSDGTPIARRWLVSAAWYNASAVRVAAYRTLDDEPIDPEQFFVKW